MAKRDGARLVLLTLAILFTAAGCATVTRKGTQGIPITSSPAGAAVSVDGQVQGTTPLVLRLSRKTRSRVVRIESQGYNPFEIRLRRDMSGGPVIGNFLLGGILGLVPTAVWAFANSEDYDANDMNGWLIWGLGTAAFGAIFTAIDANGKGQGFSPTEIVVTLTRSEGPPRVETMYLDPRDLDNITWIRVHRD